MTLPSPEPGRVRRRSARTATAARYAPTLVLLVLGVTVTGGFWLRGARQRWANEAVPPPAIAVAGERGEDRPNRDSKPPQSAAGETSAAPPMTDGTTADRTVGVAPQELARRALTLPVDGVARDDLRDTFTEGRVGHVHEAIDILAPRNTPVRAVEDGVIAKLFNSVPGGITIYQFDPAGDYCYYYAHLERYADGLENGQRVRRGEVIGYVGTSGNAPANTPHLHFAIYRLNASKRWWEGTPLDPYPILHDAAR